MFLSDVVFLIGSKFGKIPNAQTDGCEDVTLQCSSDSTPYNWLDKE